MKKNYLNKLSVVLGLGVASIALSGCDSFRNTFGLDHYQPDEFKVSDNSPLSMPKDYKLRPPAGSGNGSEGSAPGVATVPSGTQTQNLLLGSSVTAVPVATKAQSGEQNLLAMASSQQQAVPNIRETVNREAAVSTNVSDSMIQRIMSWKEEAARNISSINGETSPAKAASNQSGHQ
jgi:hypothetical protein